MRLPLKQSLGGWVWSGKAKRLKLAAKKPLIKCHLMTSSTWPNQCVHTFTYQKQILNAICKNGK